jgi:hypothetical protein
MQQAIGRMLPQGLCEGESVVYHQVCVMQRPELNSI